MEATQIFKQIEDYAIRNKVISDKEIVFIWKKYKPEFNDAYKSILIEKLTSNGVVYCYDKNKYKSCLGRKRFIPYFDETIEKDLRKHLNGKEILISYFDSSIYNELSSLQSYKRYIFIGAESYSIKYLIDQIEKDDKEAIQSNDLYKLRKFFKGIDLNFDYVIKSINEDTPLIKNKDKTICYPKLETLLVDLLADKTLSDIYSSEAINIFHSALRKYAIKINTLLRYAEKRYVKDQIIDIFNYLHFNVENGEFYD